jgi:hypothetical protein
LIVSLGGGQVLAELGVRLRGTEEEESGGGLAVEVEVENQEEESEEQGGSGGQLKQLLKIAGRRQFEGVHQQVGRVEQVQC